MTQRRSKLSRKTSETEISLELNLDGQGQYQFHTGNGMLDHLLAQLSRHGLMDLNISAQGDTEVGWHHVVEDVSITLGRALREAVGEALLVIPLDQVDVVINRLRDPACHKARSFRLSRNC